MLYLALACRCTAGVVFAVAAISKVRGPAAYRAFAAWLDGLTALPVPVRGWAAPVLIAVEVTVTVTVALPWTATAGLLLAAVTLAAFAVGVAVMIGRGATEPCQCFGASSVPLGPRHVIRNALGCAVAAFGAVGAANAGHPVIHPFPAVFSVGCGFVLALLLIFTDDIAVLFSAPFSKEVRP
jgi:hypothetical protein